MSDIFVQKSFHKRDLSPCFDIKNSEQTRVDELTETTTKLIPITKQHVTTSTNVPP